MRYFEIASGFRLPISREEQIILSKIRDNDGIIPVSSFTDERSQEVARNMVSRGLLHKSKDKDGTLIYRPNSVDNILVPR